MSADPKLETPDEIAAQIVEAFNNGPCLDDCEAVACILCRICSKQIAQIIAAALEQKDGRIRDLEQERDAALRHADISEACARDFDVKQPFCEHANRYAFTDDGGKTGHCVKCRKLRLEQANKELLEVLAALRLNAAQLGDFMYGAVRECSQDMICVIDAALSKHGGAR